ncbi:hypothetical protein [uncultured Methanobrevibacter sp.]|uniref:hypothetical protein n=1 Tax=uncultured Methanobrevibacter sp. TaxID=253161 RepID=UPI0025E48A36|nr:hypothetical protein [uncultured Methanobrevibacter sp.]
MRFSGFLNVYQLDDMSWEYQFGDKSLKANTLKELEVLVSLYGLKWSRLDDALARESLKRDNLNRTGFLNVYLKESPRGYVWCYRGSSLSSSSLEVLKKNVLREGLEWKVTDDDLANRSFAMDLKKFGELLF